MACSEHAAGRHLDVGGARLRPRALSRAGKTSRVSQGDEPGVVPAQFLCSRSCNATEAELMPSAQVPHFRGTRLAITTGGSTSCPYKLLTSHLPLLAPAPSQLRPPALTSYKATPSNL